jgi:EmrB/QacA subfamily drug resistance transporter
MLMDRIVPLIVAVALFMENMDSTIIATALPSIAADIGTNPLALKLAITSYLLALAIFIPASGWFADRFGPRNVFCCAIAVFMVGSIGCAMSDSLGNFVVARFIQGAGGAMMSPIGRLVLLRTFDKKQIVLAMTWVSIPALVGPVLGPPVGGFITTYFTWHWIFFINIPMGFLGIALAMRFIPKLGTNERVRFDFLGFVLCGIGIGGLAFGLTAIGVSYMPIGAVVALVAAGAVSTTAYIIHAKRTPNPLLDLSLFELPTFRNSVIGGFIFRIGVGATPFLLPLLFQLGFGLDPLQSGLLTCTTAIGAMFIKTLTVFILRRFGFRTVLSINGVAASLVVMAFGLFSSTTPHSIIALVLLLSGCLRSLQFTALNAISFADIAPEKMSQAASFSSMAQRLSQSAGIAAGAYLLQLSSNAQGHASIVAADFWPAFVGIGLVSALAPLLHLRLPPQAGIEVSGHGVPARGRH